MRKLPKEIINLICSFLKNENELIDVFKPYNAHFKYYDNLRFVYSEEIDISQFILNIAKNPNCIDILFSLPGIPRNILDMFKHYISSNENCCQYLEKNPWYIEWFYLSENPNAMPIIVKNLDKVYWNQLVKNREALDILLNNLDKFYFGYLAENPSAIHIIERFLEEPPNSYNNVVICTISIIKLTSMEKIKFLLLNLVDIPPIHLLKYKWNVTNDTWHVEFYNKNKDLLNAHYATTRRSVIENLHINKNAIHLIRKYSNLQQREITDSPMHLLVKNENATDIILENTHLMYRNHWELLQIYNKNAYKVLTVHPDKITPIFYSLCPLEFIYDFISQHESELQKYVSLFASNKHIYKYASKWEIYQLLLELFY
jgi:hypothetical protein